jgi:hypothetical protein
MSESLRGFPVRQDPFKERTAHTKCGLYLLRPSLAAALLDGLFEQPAKRCLVLPFMRTTEILACQNTFPEACLESNARDCREKRDVVRIDSHLGLVSKRLR